MGKIVIDNARFVAKAKIDIFFKLWVLPHGALKLEKSAISKVQKHIFCHLKNGKKINFCTRKKV